MRKPGELRKSILYHVRKRINPDKIFFESDRNKAKSLKYIKKILLMYLYYDTLSIGVLS